MDWLTNLFNGISSGINGLFTGVTNTFDAFGDFFSALIDPHTYVRLFFIVLGFAMAIGALVYGTG